MHVCEQDSKNGRSECVGKCCRWWCAPECVERWRISNGVTLIGIDVREDFAVVSERVDEHEHVFVDIEILFGHCCEHFQNLWVEFDFQRCTPISLPLYCPDESSNGCCSILGFGYEKNCPEIFSGYGVYFHTKHFVVVARSVVELIDDMVRA